MIVVKIELHSARTGKISELGRMNIANDATGHHTVGNYTAKVMKAPKWLSVTRGAEVKGHRRQALPIWALVAKALNNMGYGEMK